MCSGKDRYILCWSVHDISSIFFYPYLLFLHFLWFWRWFFLCFKEEPLEDLRTYVSSHSIVPDSCIFSDSKYFSSMLRNLWWFRRAAVLWIGTNRQGVDTDLYKLIYIDLQKGSYHMWVIGKLVITIHTEISLFATGKALLDHLCLLVTIRTLIWSIITQAII